MMLAYLWISALSRTIPVMALAEQFSDEPWIPEDTFASRLILIRRQLDLTTEEAAERCGLKAPTWNTWENGTVPRGMDSVVQAISAGLGVNRDWLIWGASSRCSPLLEVQLPSGQMELALDTGVYVPSLVGAS